MIVYGSRSYSDKKAIREAIELYVGPPPALIVHGACRGADKLAGEAAMWMGYEVEEHPANWMRHGKAAGPIRNQELVDLGADLAVGFGDGKGTADMTRRCIRGGIPVRRIR